MAYHQVKGLVDQDLSSQLDARVREAGFSVERQVSAYTEVLKGLQSHFVVQPDLSRAEFRQGANSLDLEHRLPGIQAIGFSPRVVPAAHGAFQSVLRREYAQDFAAQPAAFRVAASMPSAEAFIVQYIEPLARNRLGLGFDQFVEPKRRAALEQARDSGELTASGRVRLFVSPGDVDGIVFFLPIFRGGAVPRTIVERRRQLLGFVFVAIRVDEMLRNVFGPELLGDLTIRIYDSAGSGTAPAAQGEPKSIFDSGNYRYAGAEPALQRTLLLPFSGSAWRLEASALPKFVGHARSWLAPTAAAVSVLLSLAVFFVMRLLDDARHRSVQALRLRERAIEASANAIIITSAVGPDYPVEYVNPAFERMTGYTAQEMTGRSLGMLHRGDSDQAGLAELRSIIGEQREGRTSMRNYRKDGSLFWSDVYIAPVKDDAGRVSHFVAAKYDITESRHYQAELEFQARHDALTGLANRSLLQDRLQQAIAGAARYNESFWVVFIDLDHFKIVNDTLGHSQGDRLLQEVARRLQAILRNNDTVARHGGDEFVLILDERNGDSACASIVQRVMAAIAQPLMIDGHEFIVSCSAGIAIYPSDGHDAETLIKHADVAMYRAKETGRNKFQIYTPALNEKALERLHLESDLRNAVERGEFVLHYQPQVSLETGRIVGMEALIRWLHPTLGMVSPARFIQIAEETGLIVPIGRWVLHTACRQNKEWQLAGLGHLRVAVNLSARQFAERDLAQSIAAVLEEIGLEPRYLEVELTEGMVMDDVDYTIGVLRELKARGMQVSIDDFGTGYSSLSYLKRFPLDVLKIDQSFVRDIDTDPEGAAIVDTIISLAHSLHLNVIAEGVETEVQLDYLRGQGCQQMQGYYFSKPLPAPAFEALLRQGKVLQSAAPCRETESMALQ